MGLLQRFARPEFRPGHTPDGAPEEQHSAQAPEEPAPPVIEPSVADQGGGSVNGPETLASGGPVRQDEPESPEGAVDTPAQQAPAEPAKKTGAEVIAFANQKGGVAKTTTTLNLAVAFAEAGKRVLAVDMDPQGNLTMSQGIDPDSVDKSMYDVLVSHIPIREVIRKREIDVACASIDLAGAEIAMSTQIGRERSLEKAFKPIPRTTISSA